MLIVEEHQKIWTLLNHSEWPKGHNMTDHELYNKIYKLVSCLACKGSPYPATKANYVFLKCRYSHTWFKICPENTMGREYYVNRSLSCKTSSCVAVWTTAQELSNYIYLSSLLATKKYRIAGKFGRRKLWQI